MTNIEPPHDFSKATAHLSMMCNGEVLAVGSGLLINFDGISYLFTASHNLTGRDQYGNLLNHSAGHRPNAMRLEGYNLDVSALLYPEDDIGMDHPFYIANELRDVAIMRISPRKCSHSLHRSFIDPEQHNALKIRIGDVGFVVGYPRGIQTQSGQGPLPIWKSVTIASEPSFTGPEQPLLIDSWGEAGLSGGPVFIEKVIRNQTHRRLVGIYTGRQKIRPDENDSRTESLGRVTPLELALELFRRKKLCLDSRIQPH